MHTVRYLLLTPPCVRSSSLCDGDSLCWSAKRPLCVSLSVHEWCEHWNIHVQLKDIDESLITEGMRSTCSNSRMFAVASLAVLARSYPLKSPKAFPRLTGGLDELSERGVAPHLVEGLCRLLGDPLEHVRVPAAVVLYCIDRQSEKV